MLVESQINMNDLMQADIDKKVGLYYQKKSRLPLFVASVGLFEDGLIGLKAKVAKGTYHAWLLSNESAKNSYLGEVTIP
jgi:hypothetical protein